MVKSFRDVSEMSVFGCYKNWPLLNSLEKINLQTPRWRNRNSFDRYPGPRLLILWLDMTAATVPVRVATMLKEELDYEGHNEFYSTDSKVMLWFTSNESQRFQGYIAKRVQFIRDDSATEPDRGSVTSRRSSITVLQKLERSLPPPQ